MWTSNHLLKVDFTIDLGQEQNQISITLGVVLHLSS